VLAYFTVFLALLWRRTTRTPLAWHVQLVAVALIAQIALGLANIVFHIPLSVAVAHNAMGAGLLLAVINLLWRFHQQALPEAAKTEPTTTIEREVTA